MSANDNGYAAYWDGRRISGNPYPPDHPYHSDWEDGWLTAQDDEEEYEEEDERE